ncbi:hypothetical protein NDU88_010756 [Pleurodeles waltl]|uniref:Uncharacterized protein n=1 Tax=Pleurodeles waltl TaxID=8319 RepID=A0AAV7QWL4_PLEWA|nr:hypothetical protein NDU88_010756 [Pleurodeles waltl]
MTDWGPHAATGEGEVKALSGSRDELADFLEKTGVHAVEARRDHWLTSPTAGGAGCNEMGISLLLVTL